MKQIDIGQTISILASIGVIAGIVFLGLELNQNNRLLVADAVSTSLEARIALQDLALNNPYLL